MISLQILHGFIAALCCCVKCILVGNITRNQAGGIAGGIAVGWNKWRRKNLTSVISLNH